MGEIYKDITFIIGCDTHTKSTVRTVDRDRERHNNVLQTDTHQEDQRRRKKDDSVRPKKKEKKNVSDRKGIERRGNITLMKDGTTSRTEQHTDYSSSEDDDIHSQLHNSTVLEY